MYHPCHYYVVLAPANGHLLPKQHYGTEDGVLFVRGSPLVNDGFVACMLHTCIASHDAYIDYICCQTARALLSWQQSCAIPHAHTAHSFTACAQQCMCVRAAVTEASKVGSKCRQLHARMHAATKPCIATKQNHMRHRSGKSSQAILNTWRRALITRADRAGPRIYVHTISIRTVCSVNVHNNTTSMHASHTR